MSTWSETYVIDKVGTHAQDVAVYSAIRDSGREVAELAMHVYSEDFRTSAKIDMELSPAQMRALAAILEKHATRLEQLHKQAHEMRMRSAA